MAARDRDPVALERFVARIPAGRAAATSEIAALSVFLCSAEADYITGQTYTIDGGLTLT
jgi:glucose 1-dehydrogenase